MVKWLFYSTLFGSALGLAVLGVIWLSLPDVQDIAKITRRPSVTILDQRGEEIASHGDVFGEPLTVSTLPPHLIQAVVATEDRRFYSHFGLDPRGIARAFVNNYKAGSVVEGGSTITQQLAKNLFLTPDRTLVRKVQEAVMALKLEVTFTKDEILSLYLNRVYLGAGTYGVDAAAKRYFGKSARALDLHEAAAIAGLLKAPSRYNPTASEARNRGRAKVVLQAMVDAGYLDPAVLALEQSALDRALPGDADRRLRIDRAYTGWFANWILTEAERVLGPPSTDIVIRTTLDARLQRQASAAVTDLIAREPAAGQAAFVALDGNGGVQAMVGGTDYRQSQFNRATRALRQPGSAFKLFVYLAALENGWTLGQNVYDGEATFEGWTPRNANGRFAGLVTLREAFARSLNPAAAVLSETIGRTRVTDAARRLGITTRIPPHPSLALGTGEVSLLEITGAYTSVANGGADARPFGITRIEDRAGRVLYEHQLSGTQLIRPHVSESLRTLMSGVVTEAGTARRAAGQALGGKTGTTEGNRDAWFIGFNQRYVAGVWVGNDDGSPMRTGGRSVSGGGLPVDIWRAALK